MSERIDELLWQAGGYTKLDGSYSLHESHLQKFAELIVFECTNAVMDGTKEGDHYAMRIEQHFDNGQGGILQFGVTE
jgi:hypothetical protein